MKKFMFFVALFALTAFGVVTSAQSAQATEVPECSVATVGTQNSANHPNSKFEIKNGQASVKYKVTGQTGCKVTVALKVYYTLKEGGLPREAQRLYKETTKTTGPGTHTITVAMPPEGCFYQLDFVRVIPDRAPGTKNEMLGYQLSGTRSCLDKDIEVCVLATKKVETIKLSEWYADKSKYSRTVADCTTPPEPGEITVCMLEDGVIDNIKESEFDAKLHSRDLDDAACTEDEEGEVLPETVAATGPGQALASLVGLGGFAGSAVYYIQSRRNLLGTLFNR